MVRYLLVTGPNRGLGLAIVRRCLLDEEDTCVIVGCRSVERGQAAIDMLIKENAAWQKRLLLLEIDAASDESVQAAATNLAAMLDNKHKIYAICNNAGRAAAADGCLTKEELRSILQLNTFGPKRVVDAFLGMLDATNGRIVNISSGASTKLVAHCREDRKSLLTDPRVTWEQIKSLADEALSFEGCINDFEKEGFGPVVMDGKSCRNGYALSKALLNSYTMAAAREQPNLKINACTPGFVETDMTRNLVKAAIWPPCLSCFAGFIIRKKGGRTPDQGAMSAMYLLFGDVEGNGGYYNADAKRVPLDEDPAMV